MKARRSGCPFSIMTRYEVSKDIVSPDDVLMLAAIYLEIVKSPWFTADRAVRDAFANYIIALFRGGLVDPDRLKAVCLEAAKSKFNRNGAVALCPMPIFLVVEDDLVQASDLTSILISSGARILGPAGSARDAFKLLRKYKRPDGAFLSMSLLNEDVLPVADKLAETGIPFAFVTGGDEWRPARFPHAPFFIKAGNVRELSAFALACRDAWSAPFDFIAELAEGRKDTPPRRLH